MEVENQAKKSSSQWWIYWVCIFVSLLVGVLAIGIPMECKNQELKNEVADLRWQVADLTAENMNLENSQYVHEHKSLSEYSSEAEVFNSIAQAIGESKKTEVNIESEDGTVVHFLYEGK